VGQELRKGKELTRDFNMPELPEVETVVQQLASVLPGKVVATEELIDLDIVGRRIERIYRKQKIIVVELTGEVVLLVHLKMTGQLIYEDKNKKQKDRVVGGHPTSDWVGSLPSKHTRAIISFKDGSKLFFNDQRKFGWLRLMDKSDWEKKVSALPPDVVDVGFTLAYLTNVLAKSSRAVKLVILDQAKMGGMGNIYANDALNIAKIHPKTPSNQLKTDAVKRLYAAMIRVIEAGISAGGASYSHFVGIEGQGGTYQDQFVVYDREGKACFNCGGVIKKISLGGRGTYFCPNCQLQ